MKIEDSCNTMALETLSSCNDFTNFIIYDTISATPFSSSNTTEYSGFMENTMNNYEENIHHEATIFDHSNFSMMNNRKRQLMEQEETMKEMNSNNNQVVQRKKRRRKPRVCKNKEEAETQRITHITVERNRRKQMNEHLAVLRSLMPESYVQRVCFVSHFFIYFTVMWFAIRFVTWYEFVDMFILLCLNPFFFCLQRS
jgi:hypothetical protein